MNRKTTWVNNGKYAVLNCGADCEYTGDCPHRGGLNYDGMMPCYRQACIELAKLEDKLESGQLVELPCIREVKGATGTEYHIYFIRTIEPNIGSIDYYRTRDKAQAEAHLKELQEDKNDY